MAYIYKIQNKINNKIYVGKTTSSLRQRFLEHVRKSKVEVERPLYRAFNKYGIENFNITLIEECSIKNLTDKEIFWIDYFNSYSNGYNATLGGEGSILYDYQLIASKYKELQNQKETAGFFNCDRKTVQKACKENGVYILSNIESAMKTHSRKVKMYSLDRKFIRSFNSLREAFNYIKEIGLSTGSFNSGANHISEVCKGKRKTAYKHIWEYE